MYGYFVSDGRYINQEESQQEILSKGLVLKKADSAHSLYIGLVLRDQLKDRDLGSVIYLDY